MNGAEMIQAAAAAIRRHQQSRRSVFARGGLDTKPVSDALEMAQSSVWRWSECPPPWLVFAMLGLAVSGGDRAAAAQQLKNLQKNGGRPDA